VTLPRRELSPVFVYLILAAGYTFLHTTVISVNLVFQVQDARLDPLQLVLVGTVLEATIFFCEIPTGVIADVISRRRSVLIGLVLVGTGLAFSGAFPRFETILIGQVIWGTGFTFISGARQAWIADEIGIERAGRIYLRSSQVEQAARIIAIPISIGLATIQLNLPIILGGVLFLPLAVFLFFTMSERGFTRRDHDGGGAWSQFAGTFIAGGRLVRRTPLLITVFCIAALYGMHSEGFDRLWVKHFYDELHFPSAGNLEPVVWIGVIRMGSALLGIFSLEFVRRRLDTDSHASVTRGLFVITAVQVVTVSVMALAGGFYMGMIAFWATVVAARNYEPLYLAWINQNVASNVRATVISMNRQMDAIGQIAGGPPIGLIGTLASLRAALLVSAMLLVPSLLLYVRALGQGRATGEGSLDPASTISTVDT
jgi:MFS transporter, DHA3 family, tetracycline resistance protein